jgi:hypothetical protein
MMRSSPDSPSPATMRSGAIPTSLLAKQYGSTFHAIRNVELYLTSETKLISIYLQSQEDPWMRERIVERCADDPDLRHITADYLDRVSKLRLFL